MTEQQQQGWPDRYRPTDLDGMALTPELRRAFTFFLANGLPRHLILSGPSGTGKTTITNILAHTLYPERLQVMRVASGETGNVDYIREKVINYMRAAFDKKLVVFEEASQLSDDAAKALREPLERFADDCRVIFITNNSDKLDKPVKSRCDEFVMERPPQDECVRVLGRILEAEGATIAPGTVRAFVRGHFACHPDADLRSLLSLAQKFFETTGTLPVPPEPPPTTALVWLESPRREDVPDGAKLLDDVADQFGKYLVLPKGGVEALTLWTVFAWAHEAFSISPILALVSPTKGAGKTTALEVLDRLLMPGRTFHTSNTTPAPLYRLKGLVPPDQAYPSPTPKPPDLCLLLDEADSWFGVRDELRGIINSGWKRRGAVVLRAGREGGQFSTWYPKALALIDQPTSPLPGTVRHRSIVVGMQKKTTGEVVERFPGHKPLPELTALAEAIAFWVRDHFAELRTLGAGEILSAPTDDDRARDNWHQLLCIAHVAGGEWEARGRQAALALADSAQETDLLIDLLTDLKQVFETEGEAVRSTLLIQKLKALEDGPWKQRRLTPFSLSKMLRPLRIRPKQLWTDAGAGKRNVQGYELAQFEDAFSRYL